MSHPADLILKIRTLLEAEYPPSRYTYVIEKCIPGTRMFPDIQIKSGDLVVCAVEVGYTRPEKLTAYRSTLKIPDVRWYDKTGVLHGDVEEKVLKLTVEPSSDLKIYKLQDQVECHEDDCVEDGEGGDPRYDVLTTLITDRVRAFLLCFCDKCGASWLADEDDSLDVLSVLESLTAQEFGRTFGAAESISWEKACALATEVFSVSLNYMEGHSVGDRAWDQDRAIAHRLHLGGTK